MKNFKTKQARNSVVALAITSGLLLTSGNVAAESEFSKPGIYAGAAYGLTRVDNEEFDDDKDSAYKVLIGAKFNRHIALEAAINNYGSAEGPGYSSEFEGNTLALVGMFPISDVIEPFIKGGKLWWKNDVEILNVVNTEFDGDEVFYGVGANFNFDEHFALRVELERYKFELSQDDVGNVDNSTDLDVASIGLVVSF
ncbi:MAG: porin family protein [Gammaproteobacteria bacterium]|nr:porin family protein [Gammaproteobacteria bacterium]